MKARFVAAAVAFTSAVAMACGHCPEDLIASVYDHALAQQGLALNHETIYFAWESPTARSVELRRKMVALAEAVSGVEKGSARVSLEPGAMSVSFAPQRERAQTMVDALGKKFATINVAIVRLPTPKAP